MRFYAEKDDVHGADFFERARDGWACHEVSLDAFHLNAVFLHGSEVRPAREERDIEPGLRHACADVGSDCARSRDQEFHCSIIHAGRRLGLPRRRGGGFFRLRWWEYFRPDKSWSDICSPPDTHDSA